jgi:hypothetical protein
MRNWWTRYQQRQIDLANGVDSDLVRDNQKKWKLTALLVVAVFVVLELDHFFHFAGLTHTIAILVAIPIAISSLVVLHWAASERRSLDSPDPEEPPSIFKL